MKMPKSFRLDKYEALDRISVQLKHLSDLEGMQGLSPKASKQLKKAIYHLAASYQKQGASFDW